LPDGAEFNEIAKLISPLGNSEPEEIAGVIAFVASEEARYMTGTIVSIDGGLTI